MKILFGALMVDGRGKIGGTVASKNRAGAYMRNKVTPNNPQTTRQQYQRMLFGSLASSWRTLGSDARESWNRGAVNFPYRDIFGNSKVYSGSQLYQKLNSNLNVVGAGLLENCPTPVEIPPMVVGIIDLDTTEITLSIDPGAIPADFSLVIYATASISAGRSYTKQLYRIVSVNPTLTSGVALLTAPYAAIFGTPTTGQLVSFKAVLISNTSGQAGVASEIAQIVA